MKATLAGSQTSPGGGPRVGPCCSWWLRASAGFSGHFVQKFAGKRSASGTKVTCYQKRGPSVAQRRASCPPWRVSRLFPSLQGGFQVRKAVRQDTNVVCKLVPMEQAGALGVSRARITPRAILAWREWTNLATRTGVETCGPEMLEILSGRRSSFSTAISALLLAF
jgi:hypothetical protein